MSYGNSDYGDSTDHIGDHDGDRRFGQFTHQNTVRNQNEGTDENGPKPDPVLWLFTLHALER